MTTTTGQSVRRSSQATLSPSYMELLSSSIAVAAWPYNGKIPMESLRKKFNETEEIAGYNLNAS